MNKNALQKTMVNVVPSSSKKLSKKRLKYGVVRMSVCDTLLLQRIYGAIKEYAKISDENLWLFAEYKKTSMS